MKFSKILLLVGIVIIVSIFAMNTSFAASSENLSMYKDSFSSNKKISTIEEVSIFNKNVPKEYCNVKIKKSYQNKYKIKSVNVKYAILETIDNKTLKFKGYLYKNYTGKNKNSLKINVLNNNNLSLEKIIVNYYTKGKIKHESFDPYYLNNFTTKDYWVGKKANAKSIQKGNFKIIKNGNIPVIKNQTINIVTKNKKYKIKAVKLNFINIKGNKISHETIKGNGKNNLKIQLNNNNNKFITDIKLYYY